MPTAKVDSIVVVEAGTYIEMREDMNVVQWWVRHCAGWMKRLAHPIEAGREGSLDLVNALAILQLW
jgi:hypothetical protein